MLIWEFFKKNSKCTHSHVKPEVDFAYCPDCGELIENQWYLVRCACCNVKLKGIVKNGEIVPEQHFCHNCGTHDYIIERIDKINFIDINYAVLVKAIVETNPYSSYQSWVNPQEVYVRPKLITGTAW